MSNPLIGCQSFDTAFVKTRRATDDDIDALGHVNNVVYVQWAQDIAVEHWETVGGEKLTSKYIFMALRHEVDYRSQIMPGDEVEIRTWLGRAKGVRFARHFDIRKPGDKRPAVEMMTDWVLLDAESRKPKRIPQEILEAFGVSG